MDHSASWPIFSSASLHLWSPSPKCALKTPAASRSAALASAASGARRAAGREPAVRRGFLSSSLRHSSSSWAERTSENLSSSWPCSTLPGPYLAE